MPASCKEVPKGRRTGNIMFVLDTEKLIGILKENNQTLWEYALNQEMERSGRTKEELREQMNQALSVMERSTQKARMEPVRSVSGLTGGNAFLYEQYRREGKSLLGDAASLAVGMALSCSEINASMQCIVACPTAGSCGIVPAAVLACAAGKGLDRECMINALFTASAIGLLWAAGLRFPERKAAVRRNAVRRRPWGRRLLRKCWAAHRRRHSMRRLWL